VNFGSDTGSLFIEALLFGYLGSQPCFFLFFSFLFFSFLFFFFLDLTVEDVQYRKAQAILTTHIRKHDRPSGVKASPEQIVISSWVLGWNTNYTRSQFSQPDLHTDNGSALHSGRGAVEHSLLPGLGFDMRS
jgi:hypothetical protein